MGIENIFAGIQLESQNKMSEDSKKEEPFDLDRLKNLIELMEKHGLTQVDLRRGNERWQLQRGPQEVMQMMPASYQAPAAMPPQPSSVPAAPTESAPSAEVVPNDGSIEITSPTVGTFYSSPTPEEPAFVDVGSKVKADTIVCIVEAMKVFNQIPAEVTGEIVKVLVKNGDPVEYGQALFQVKPA